MVTYNKVQFVTPACSKGELLTDHELERLKLNFCKYDWPTCERVSVRREDVYFLFGRRFALNNI